MIDTSEWLPESPNKLYPLAFAKMIDTQAGAVSSEISPLDYLLDRDVIDYDQHKAGWLLVNLRMAINNGLGTDRMILSYTQGEPLEKKMGNGLLLSLMLRGINHHDKSLLDDVCKLRTQRHQAKPMSAEYTAASIMRVKEILDKLKINIDKALELSKTASMPTPQVRLS